MCTLTAFIPTYCTAFFFEWVHGKKNFEGRLHGNFFFEGKDYTATWLTMAGPLPKVSIGPKFGDRPICENIVGWPLTLTWPPSSQQLYALSCLLSLGLTVVSGSLRSISRPFFSKFLSFCDKKGLEKNSENIFGEIEKNFKGNFREREKNSRKILDR